MRKYLVLGGGGFIGSHLCEALVNTGNEVFLFDRFNFNKNNINNFIDKVNIIERDYNVQHSYDDLLDEVDCVFHLISTTVPAISNKDKVFDISSNVLSTINLLEQMRKSKCNKIVFLSSGGTVYGPSKKGIVNEEHPTNPICSYGIQKLTIEKYLQMFALQYGLKAKVLRVANPYGPRQNTSNGQGAIGAFISKALKDEEIEIWGDGSISRDYIYISDLIDGMILSAECEENYSIYNLGCGQGITLNDIIACIENILNKKLKIQYKESRPFDVPVNILDTEKFKNQYDWYPKIDLATGIEKTINAAMQNLNNY